MIVREKKTFKKLDTMPVNHVCLSPSIHIHPKNREVVCPNKKEVDLLYPSPGLFLEIDRAISRNRPGDLNTGL